jgi:hypothetical protein
MAYREWSDEQLEAALEERAAARQSAFSVSRLGNGNWFASMEQMTPLGIAVVQSGEGADRHATLVALLQADDFANATEGQGGPRLGD